MYANSGKQARNAFLLQDRSINRTSPIAMLANDEWENEPLFNYTTGGTDTKPRCQVVSRWMYPPSYNESTAYGKALTCPRVTSGAMTPFSRQTCPCCDPSSSKRPLCAGATQKLQDDTDPQASLWDNLISRVDEWRNELSMRKVTIGTGGSKLPTATRPAASPSALQVRRTVDKGGIGEIDEAAFEAKVSMKRGEISDWRYQALQMNLECFRNEAAQLHEDMFKTYRASLSECNDLRQRLTAAEGALAIEKSNVKRLNVSMREAELTNCKLKMEIRELSEQRVARDSDVASRTLAKEEAKSMVAKIERENAELKRQLETAVQSSRDAKQLAAQLQTNLDTAVREKERLEGAAAVGDQTTSGQVAKMKSMIDQLQQEVKLGKTALEEAKNYTETIKKELETTKQNNATLSAKLNKLSNAESKLMATRQDHEVEKAKQELHPSLQKKSVESSAATTAVLLRKKSIESIAATTAVLPGKKSVDSTDTTAGIASPYPLSPSTPREEDEDSSDDEGLDRSFLSVFGFGS